MTKAPYAMNEMNCAEQRQAALAGTRMLLLEEMFDAMLALLVDSGAVKQEAATLMLHRLSDRLSDHADHRTDTNWMIVPDELIDQAQRITGRAALLRGRP